MSPSGVLAKGGSKEAEDVDGPSFNYVAFKGQPVISDMLQPLGTDFLIDNFKCLMCAS
jgi:hypothetical protein